MNTELGKVAVDPNREAEFKKEAERTGRGKTWEECSIEQRIERLRDTQRDLRRFAHSSYGEVHRDMHLLKNHHHGADGSVAISIHHTRQNLGDAAGCIDTLA